MDALKSALGGGNKQTGTEGNAPTGQQKEGGGGFLGGIGNKVNSAAGGGPESEKNEDGLDKGVLSPFPLSTEICI